MFTIKNFLKSQIPVIVLLLTAGYICIGALIIRSLESKGGGGGRLLKLSGAPLNKTAQFNTSSTYNNYSSELTTSLGPDTGRPKPEPEEEAEEEDDGWSFGSAVLFTFSVVTTIGYGHIAPVTVGGRIFIIFYAIIGIPLGMLGIANIGKYVSKGILMIYCVVHKYIRKLANVYHLRTSHRKISTGTTSITQNGQAGTGGTGVPKSEQEDVSVPDTLPSSVLILCFLLWILMGCAILPRWETSMNTWDAFWFSFISLTTIGFGDIYPTNYPYFALTYIYLMAGLVFTTMAIDVLAEYLRQVHNYGRKLTNLGKTKIWFGGASINTNDLFTGVMQQMPIEQSIIAATIQNLDVLIGNALSKTPPIPEPPPPESESESEEEDKEWPNVLQAFPKDTKVSFMDEESSSRASAPFTDPDARSESVTTEDDGDSEESDPEGGNADYEPSVR